MANLAFYSRDLILFSGLKRARVASYDSNLWIPSDENVRDKIGKVWAERVKVTQERGGSLTNGLVVRVNWMESRDGESLDLGLQVSDYKTHVGTRDDPAVPSNQKALPLYVAGMLHTADGYFVFGASEATEAQFIGKLNISAGGFMPEDINFDTPSGGLDEAFLRELIEEVGLRRDHISSIHPSYVMKERDAPHPSLMYEVETILDKEWVRKIHAEHVNMLRKTDLKPEFSHLEFICVDRGVIRDVLGNPERFQDRVQVILQYYIDVSTSYAFEAEAGYQPSFKRVTRLEF